MSNLLITMLPQTNTSLPSDSSFALIPPDNHKDHPSTLNNEHFLNYLIQENTHYADFDKIESRYLSQLYAKVDKYNSNKLLLSQKEQEYASILQELQSEITCSLCITNPSFLDEYTPLITNTNQVIRVKDHELHCYTRMYTRLYKANYLVRKRFDDEGRFVPINEKQYEKYVLIKNHAMIAMTNQMTALNDLKSVDEISVTKYEREIAERTKHFNELEFQILMIKKDSANVEVLLKGIQRRKGEVRKAVEMTMKENDCKYDNAFVAKCEYYRYLKQLLEIFFQLSVKDVESTIEKFNMLNKVHYDLSSLFDHSNREIARLNNELTRMKKELTEIRLAIDAKNQKDLEGEESGRDRMSPAELKVRVKESQFYLMKLQSKYKDKENYLKIIFVFMLNYMQLMADSMRISAFPNYFSLCKSSTPYAKLLTVNKDSSQLSLSSFSFNKQFLKLSFAVFKEFVTHLFTLLASAFNLVCIENFFALSSIGKQFKVYDLYSGMIYRAFDEQISNAIVRQENKRHILGRSDREIFEGKEIKRKGKKRLKERKLEITDTSLYQNYMKFLLKDRGGQRGSVSHKDQLLSLKKKEVVQPSILASSLKNKRFEVKYMQLFPNRSLSIMNRYTNDLVIKNTKLIKNKLSIKSSKDDQSSLFEGIEPQYAFDLPALNCDRDSSFIALDDTSRTKLAYSPLKPSRASINANKSISTSTSSINRMKYYSKAKNSGKDKGNEISRIYTRLNDLRKLEYFYFKTHDKSLIGDHVFNDIYFKYKRKHLDKNINNRSHGSIYPSKAIELLNSSSRRSSYPPFIPGTTQRIKMGNSSLKSGQSNAFCKSHSTKARTSYSIIQS